MKKILLNDLYAFSRQALLKAGLSEENAQKAAEVLVTTDTFGVMSHGTKNLYQYILKMKEGGLNATAEPTIEREGPAWAIVNGNASLGMLCGHYGMSLAIEKAKKTGIAYVGVKDSCHFGAAGYYANMAAKEGLIGLSMSNADPNMAIPGSRGVAIGNNPFSFAAPLPGGRSLFLDIALSSVAALKVVMAREKGIEVPKEWLVDSDGQPTSDPSGFPGKSFLQPMAAHKGYGFAVMVEILASVITGAGLLREVASWNLDLPSRNNAGHAFIAVDIAQMLPLDDFKAKMEQLIEELHNAPKAKGTERIFVPGEMEWEKRDAVLKTGEITLTDAMVENFDNLSELLDLPVKYID